MSSLDPEVEHMLELAKQADRPPLEALTPAEARDAYAASWDVLQPPRTEVGSVRNEAISGPGGPLQLRIYRGAATQSGERLPCLLYLHGGGWVIGNLESHDRLCRQLANLAGICVVAVDYRLAPEHRYPAAVDDAVAALHWVERNAAALSIAPDRIAVGGDSAGGNLAAVLALMARDGSVPPVSYQALLYPALDLAADSESYRKVTAGVSLTAATMRYFIDHYTPSLLLRKDWRASPLQAASLAGTAAALVLTVAHDPLCDEGRAYAARLEAEGVRVTALHLSDHMHGMLLTGKLVRASNTILSFVAAAIGLALHSPTPARP
ncbi:alpha/beta hydrolase [Variovorax sp. J31P207]|uniref:alpha/beta hydrolase n=1 Tax=Variovorax sp. J31P207 TaxID=3053510 RepID=UPI0025750672|nr:alpha/beta hydrolase [Variovorax sp. J31P207]MDM0069988.1 alpha/beta hydrolase [Variovorax sp. J31P207]